MRSAALASNASSFPLAAVLLAPLALLASLSSFACTPAPSEAAASSEQAVTSASLVGHWVGAEGGIVSWIAIARASDGTLTYRAGRSRPWRNERGTLEVDGSTLVLAHEHVEERLRVGLRGSELTLRLGDGEPATLTRAARTPTSLPVAAPFEVVSTATRASDGKIYATGPARAANHAETSFGAFDPKTRTWSTLAPVPHFAQRPATVAGADGRVYLLGGSDANIQRNYSGAVAAVQAYDTEVGSWLELPPLPESRSDAGAAVCPDGRIVVIGGVRMNGLGHGPLATYYRRPILYDPRTGKSTAGADAGFAVVGPAVAAAAGTIYAVGGVDHGDGNGNAIPTQNSTSRAAAYDCRTDTWRALPFMPTSRARATAVTDERGRLYVIGGTDGGGSYRERRYTSTEVFDPETERWSTIEQGISGLSANVVAGPDHFWTVSARGLAALDMGDAR